MYDRVIGTCSICGGAVAVPSVWHGVIPPTPICQGCGAVPSTHGPVIDMKPAPPMRVTTTNTAQFYDEEKGPRVSDK